MRIKVFEDNKCYYVKSLIEYLPYSLSVRPTVCHSGIRVCVVCVTSLLSRLEFGARTHIRQICRLVSLPLAFSLFVVPRLLPIYHIDIS